MANVRIAHFSLAVRDLAAARGFYQAAFGFTAAFEARDLADRIARMTGRKNLTCDLVQLRHPETSTILELIRFSEVPADGEGPPPAHLALTVPDLSDADERVRSHGAERLGEIVTFDDGQAAYYRVPGGSVLELEEVQG